MNTAAARLLLIDFDLDESKLSNGTQRFMRDAGKFCVEIIPDKSVVFFVTEVTKEVVDIIDLYLDDMPKTLDLLRRAAVFVATNPNTSYTENIGDELVLKCAKIQQRDRARLHLAISQK